MLVFISYYLNPFILSFAAVKSYKPKVGVCFQIKLNFGFSGTWSLLRMQQHVRLLACRAVIILQLAGLVFFMLADSQVVGC